MAEYRFCAMGHFLRIHEKISVRELHLRSHEAKDGSGLLPARRETVSRLPETGNSVVRMIQTL